MFLFCQTFIVNLRFFISRSFKHTTLNIIFGTARIKPFLFTPGLNTAKICGNASFNRALPIIESIVLTGQQSFTQTIFDSCYVKIIKFTLYTLCITLKNSPVLGFPSHGTPLCQLEVVYVKA